MTGLMDNLVAAQEERMSETQPQAVFERSDSTIDYKKGLPKDHSQSIKQGSRVMYSKGSIKGTPPIKD